MLTLAVILTVLGGLMPVGALIWAALVTRREFRTLDDDLARVQEIAGAGLEPNESRSLMYTVREPTTNYTTALYMREEVQRAILASALKDYKGPALLAGAGALAGMVGSLLGFAV